MKSKNDSGRMMNRVASLQEENEALHVKVAELRKKIAMQEKALAILKKVCGNDAISKLKRDDEFCKDL